LYFYCAEAMKRGVRPWVWSDYYWSYPQMFLKMMPKYVVQSNWYFRDQFGLSEKTPPHIRKIINTYPELAEAGYEQIPTGSNDGVMWGPQSSNDRNIGNTVDFCAKRIPDGQLLGFLQSMWMPTTEKYQPHILNAIKRAGEARKRYESIRKQPITHTT